MSGARATAPVAAPSVALGVPRREFAAVTLLALAAVLVWALVPTYPNYDTYYHLVWGRELFEGQKPTFEAYQAPTQHPLYLLLAALAGLAGESADRILVLFSALSMVALVWAVYRLGRATFGPWTGLAAAALTGSSFALLLYAARAYVDVPFLALVMWAAALEAERPRRGALVMVLLALAGLLRPEAWLLAGAYWLWCAWPQLARALRSRPPRRELRPGLLALALLGPVVWALVDLWATGDPLHSLNATSQLAEELNRDRGLRAVPGAFAGYLVDTLRPPVLLAAIGGVALAWRRQESRALHVPVALLICGGTAFAATGAAGLSILPRYLTVPAIALTIYAGYAFTGWISLPRSSPLRRRWMAAVAVVFAAGLVLVAARLSVVDRFTTELRYIGAVHDDLAAALASPAVKQGRLCGPVTLPNYRLVPDARWMLGASVSEVGARSALRRRAGVAIFYPDRKTLSRYGFADGASPSTNAPDPGFAPAGRFGRIAVYVACPQAP